nr:putative large membrane protein [Kibdelosporangium sp. MJ126-NF4]
MISPRLSSSSVGAYLALTGRWGSRSRYAGGVRPRKHGNKVAGHLWRAAGHRRKGSAMRIRWWPRRNRNEPGAADATASAFRAAGTDGLSLVGPGAISAARAIVVHALSGSESGLGPGGRLVIPQVDLDLLLGGPYSRVASDAVTVTGTLDTAVDLAASAAAAGQAVLLVGSVEPQLRGRVGALLSPAGTTRVTVLGAGLGRVVDVREDGCVEPRSDFLGRRRLFTEPRDDVQAVRASCGRTPTRANVKPFALRVLGSVTLEFWEAGKRREVTHVLTPKQQELLVYLAVAGEEGARREALNRAVWPGSPPGRPYNSLHNALSKLRSVMLDVSSGAVRDVVLRSGPHYRINRDVVDVDYWRLRRSDYRALALYRGDVGEGIESLWLALPREAMRHKVIESAAKLFCGGRHDKLAGALSALESIRAVDPCNEYVYRELIGAQLSVGCIDLARETYDLLVEMLDEIGRQPDIRTRNLLLSG